MEPSLKGMHHNLSRLRQNRQTGALFTGCSAYPGCAFREPHDGYGKELCNFPDGTDNWLISGRLL